MKEIDPLDLSKFEVNGVPAEEPLSILPDGRLVVKAALIVLPKKDTIKDMNKRLLAACKKNNDMYVSKQPWPAIISFFTNTIRDNLYLLK